MKSVVFKTSGILDLRAITIFGCSAKPKTNSPIGYFGTGLKYTLAVLAREGCEVAIYRGLDKPLKLKVNETSFRDTTLQSLILGEQELPFTTDLGKNWQLWQALRELESNTVDEKGFSSLEEGEIESEAGYTKIVVSSDDFIEVYKDIDTIFLNPKTEDISSDSAVEIYPKPSKYLFYKGIRVYEYNKEAEFTYNITSGIELTENRTIAHWFYVERSLAQALSKMTDKGHIEKLLGSNGMESTLDFNDSFNNVNMVDEFKELVIELAPENHTAKAYIKRLEDEEREEELETERKSPEELFKDMLDDIFEVICFNIEQPAGAGAGYGITIEGQNEVKEIIENYINNKG